VFGFRVGGGGSVTSDTKGMVRDYQDLEVWQMAMDLCEQVYRLA
jgi:hypothetical protein